MRKQSCSRTTFYRRKRQAVELGCSVDKLPDNRGKHGGHKSGNNHPRWNGGHAVSSHGYNKIRVGKDHPIADPNGYAYEHILVWMSAGRSRGKVSDVLHHRNGNVRDNRIENLERMSRGKHLQLHIAG